MEFEQELVLKQENLLSEESALSPEKEVKFRTKIAALEEEIADLKQQLARK